MKVASKAELMTVARAIISVEKYALSAEAVSLCIDILDTRKEFYLMKGKLYRRADQYSNQIWELVVSIPGGSSE